MSGFDPTLDPKPAPVRRLEVLTGLWLLAKTLEQGAFSCLPHPTAGILRTQEYPNLATQGIKNGIVGAS